MNPSILSQAFHAISVVMCLFFLITYTEAQGNMTSREQFFLWEKVKVNQTTSNLKNKQPTNEEIFDSTISEKKEARTLLLNSTLEGSTNDKTRQKDAVRQKKDRPAVPEQLMNYPHRNQTGNYQHQLEVEDAIERITKEVDKAIAEHEENKNVIKDTVARTFDGPVREMRETAAVLRTFIPDYERAVSEQNQVSHTTMQFLVTQSEENYHEVLREMRDNMIVQSDYLTKAVLNEQTRRFANVMYAKMKQLELETLMAHMQDQLDLINIQMTEQERYFNSQQMQILNQLESAPLTKNDIVKTLQEIFENIQKHPQDKMTNKERDKELKNKVVETLEFLKIYAMITLEQMQKDYEALHEELPKEANVILETISKRSDGLKIGYIRRAVENEDQRRDREQEVYKKYLENTEYLDSESWNKLAARAWNFSVEKGFHRHQKLAKIIEEARGTIKPLPELIRSVNIRTVTMVLAYSLLALAVFGVLCLGAQGTLLLAQVMMATTARQQRRRDASLAEPQQNNFWGAEQTMCQVLNPQFRMEPSTV